MNDDLKANVTSRNHWMRFLYMLLFAVILYFASVVVFAVVVLQFIFALLTGGDNENLRKFGASLSSYIYQCLQFLTYASDDKPFPFTDWPEGECLNREKPLASSAEETEAVVEHQPDDKTEKQE